MAWATWRPSSRTFRDRSGKSYNGKKFPGGPELNLNGLVQYEIPTSFGYVIPQLDVSFVDEYFADLDNTAAYHVPRAPNNNDKVDGRTFDTTLGDFWDVNIRLSFTDEAQALRFTLFVENVTGRGHADQSLSS